MVCIALSDSLFIGHFQVTSEHGLSLQLVTAAPPRLWHNPAMRNDDSKHEAEVRDSKPVDRRTATKADHSASRERKTPVEIGGRGGLDPTRYGDWEKAGRCVDF
jgi:hypothetical protein